MTCKLIETVSMNEAIKVNQRVLTTRITLDNPTFTSGCGIKLNDTVESVSTDRTFQAGGRTRVQREFSESLQTRNSFGESIRYSGIAVVFHPAFVSLTVGARAPRCAYIIQCSTCSSVKDSTPTRPCVPHWLANDDAGENIGVAVKMKVRRAILPLWHY